MQNSRQVIIRENPCQRLLLVEYFELKITDCFLRMLSKNDLSFF